MNTLAYKTTELELASFLKARGHRLLFARLDGRVVAFEFSQRGSERRHVRGIGDAALDVESYFNGREVSPRELFDAPAWVENTGS